MYIYPYIFIYTTGVRHVSRAVAQLWKGRQTHTKTQSYFTCLIYKHIRIIFTKTKKIQGYITYLGPLPNFDKMPPKIPEPPAPVVDTHILRFGIAVEIGEAAMDADKQHVVQKYIFVYMLHTHL